MASCSSKKQSKRRKEKHTIKELKTLGDQLLSSRSHINNLSIILRYVKPDSPPQHVLQSLLSLQPFFTTMLPHLPSPKPDDNNNNNPEFIYATWLRARFHDFINLLLDFLVSTLPEEPLKLHAGFTMEFIVDLLASKYFNYIDVRYFTYISLEKLATTLVAQQTISDEYSSKAASDDGVSKTSMEASINNIHYILSRIPSQKELDDKSENTMWSEPVKCFVAHLCLFGLLSHQGDSEELSATPKAKKSKNKKDDNILSAAKIMRKMKLKFTKAWISFLRLPLPVDTYKEVLVSLHQTVIPYLSNPVMLSDFLTRSYDIGGVVSVMALSSLFILMTQHGLEYPDFYEKLYDLLEPTIFLAKHRAKFFELLDLCLKSALLPAYLAAAFAKKLSRLALSAPPSGAIVIIALIHNLLRRHPSINCLVHRELGFIREDGVGAGQTGEKAGVDHFSEESKPIKSNAMRSSLWEIDSLRHHFSPSVSRFVLSLENDLTVRAKTTELDISDFSSGSYATVFNDEIRRRIKQVPVAFSKTAPSTLFSESDFPGWTFDYESNNAEDGENSDVVAKRQRVES
ncbi:hypothetical protein ACFE04_012674 [Oxalis oulophora]